MSAQIIYITRTGQRARNGCEQLRCALYVDGIEKAHVFVVSGGPDRQNFRTRAHEVAEQREPIAEGVYRLGPVEWAGQPGDWSKLWPKIWSAIWITIDPTRATGFHLDAQDDGTAGCVGTANNEDLERIAYWRAHGADVCIVDHGFGTVEAPRPPGKPAKLERVRAWVHPGAARARRAGKDVDLVLTLQIVGGKPHLMVDGVARELATLQLDCTFKV